MLQIFKNLENPSEKELKIYNGVALLLNSGKDFHDIKISDIAAIAGIGKGTVYEYFESKQEIVGKTLLFQLHRSHLSAKAIIESDKPFKEIFFSLLDNTYYIFEGQASTFKKLVVEFCKNDKKNSDIELREQQKAFMAFIDNKLNFVIDGLIKAGIKQQVIKQNDDKEFMHFAVRAAITTFVNSINRQEQQSQYNQLKENAYKLMIKSLS